MSNFLLKLRIISLVSVGIIFFIINKNIFAAKKTIDSKLIIPKSSLNYMEVLIKKINRSGDDQNKKFYQEVFDRMVVLPENDRVSLLKQLDILDELDKDLM